MTGGSGGNGKERGGSTGELVGVLVAATFTTRLLLLQQ